MYIKYLCILTIFCFFDRTDRTGDHFTSSFMYFQLVLPVYFFTVQYSIEGKMSSSCRGFLSPLLVYYIILTIFSWFEAHTVCIFSILLALNNLSNKSGITIVDKKTVDTFRQFSSNDSNPGLMDIEEGRKSPSLRPRSRSLR
jgi:vacuolar-type H+-ATPase subunit I/STV1